jgi:hypothetical protein
MTYESVYLSSYLRHVVWMVSEKQVCTLDSLRQKYIENILVKFLWY